MTTALATAVKEETVQGADGLKIFVRSWRPAAPARGVVAICHGVNSHSGYYPWAAEQLVAERPGGVRARSARPRQVRRRAFLHRVDQRLPERRRHARERWRNRASQGCRVFLLGHSAGGVISCVYTLEHQSELAGLICESFAFQVAAPDFALAVVKGLSHIAPHAHVLRLKNEEFSRDPKVVQAMNDDPLIEHETQPTKTVAELVRADERLKEEFRAHHAAGVHPPRDRRQGDEAGRQPALLRQRRIR